MRFDWDCHEGSISHLQIIKKFFCIMFLQQQIIEDWTLFSSDTVYQISTPSVLTINLLQMFLNGRPKYVTSEFSFFKIMLKWFQNPFSVFLMNKDRQNIKWPGDFQIMLAIIKTKILSFFVSHGMLEFTLQ